MARVAVVFTGGTISMGFDPVAGGNVPTLDGAAILARTSGLDAIADVVPIDRGLTPASHFTFADLMALGRVVQEALDDEAIDGVVVVQGTDTIEETAFAWDLVLDSSEAVVVTGAMRASHEEGYEARLTCAGRWRWPPRRRCGMPASWSSLAGTIEAADDVTKMHTHGVRHVPFAERGLARPGRGGRRGRRSSARAVRDVASAPCRADGARVELVQAGDRLDGAMIDAAVGAGARGLVVAATGAGNTSPAMLAAAERAMADGVTVVLASRCPSGAVSTAYAFPGGGATWARAGAIPVGTLCAIKARVAVALGLGAGLGRDDLAELLADPVG